MSLDVWLTIESIEIPYPSNRIFIREEGSIKEISLEEWYIRYPTQAPITLNEVEDELKDRPYILTIYEGNITHNLTKMAEVVDLYTPLWHPEELHITKAEQLIPYLSQGYIQLLNRKEELLPLNPKNGWGSYDGLVTLVKDYLKACIDNPMAKVNTWV